MICIPINKHQITDYLKGIGKKITRYTPSEFSMLHPKY